jgi:putative resolvase
MGKYLSVGKVAKIFGVHTKTIDQWRRKGKINGVKTPGGVYRYSMEEINHLLGKSVNKNKAVIYARVSSNDQKEHGDLDRQIDILSKYAEDRNIEIADTISDVASGLNTNRRGLKKLYKYIDDEMIGKVLITYEDRLTRFGYEYLEHYFDQNGVEIVVAKQNDKKSLQEDLVNDLISIITSFSGRLYGLRSHKNKIIKEIKEAVQ